MRVDQPLLGLNRLIIIDNQNMKARNEQWVTNHLAVDLYKTI